jgi:hypothetical protein
MTDHSHAHRHDGWTPAARAAFLDALAKIGSVAPALAAVGKASSGAYALRRRDPDFRAAWDAAIEQARVPVHTRLVERAMTGEWIRFVDADGHERSAIYRHDTRFALALLTRLERKAARRDAVLAAVSLPEPGETPRPPARSARSGGSVQSAHCSDSPFQGSP